MPRIRRTQKEREKFLISMFCDEMGYSVSRAKWQDKPDALLTLSKGKSKQRVAVEHTDYFNDTLAGQRSPLTPIDEFWQRVQRSLMRRISHRPGLAAIVANVRLKTSLPNWRASAAEAYARRLAGEIVAFLEAHPMQAGQPPKTFHSRRPHFAGYKTLGSLVCSLRVRRSPVNLGRVSRCDWVCSNTAVGCVRINIDFIKSAIKNKSLKARNYHDWGKAQERWLLIVAGGDNINTHAGDAAQTAAWNDMDLATLCQQSLFHRVFFWERVSRWCKPLKPNGQIVSLGQRAACHGQRRGVRR